MLKTYVLRIARIGGLAVLLAPSLVFAQGVAPVGKVLDSVLPRREIRQDKQEKRLDRQEERKEARTTAQEARGEIRTKRQEVRQEAQDSRQLLRQEVKERRSALQQEVRIVSPVERRVKLEEFRKDVQQKRETIRQEIQQKREEFRAKAEERKKELKKKVGEIRARRIEEFFGNMTRRLDAAINRLHKLSDRIQSRLDKLVVAGKDVSAQQALLDTADTAIDAAQTALDDARAKFGGFAVNENPKEAFAAVRDAVHAVSAKVREAHRALVDVVVSVKQGRLDAKEDAATESSGENGQ